MRENGTGLAQCTLNRDAMSRRIDDYLQKSGRGGRSGGDAQSIVITVF